MTVPATAPTPAAAVREGSWAATRARIALVLVLLYAGASTVRWLQRAAAWPPVAGQDEISVTERRFAKLRTTLPARGLVGYVGDPEPTGATAREANAAALLHFRRYLLAQYFLAPVLLVENLEPAVVVGNFEVGATPPTPAGFRIVREFGDGLVLFRRTDR
jgi:hypothetical protein